MKGLQLSHELIWTAAAKTHVAKEGGRSGGSGTGYGNVRLTRGIPQNLTRLLENLQAYRELSVSYRDNQQTKTVSPKIVPVEYFHFIGKYTGQPLQILGRRARSRAASGRSNLIVHLVTHFLSDFHNVPLQRSAGPAAEARALPWQTSWAYDAEPTFQEDATKLEPSLTSERNCRRCKLWESITGDPGWAAIPVERALEGRTVALIVPRTRDWSLVALELFDESMQLMEPTARWLTGFSTYWTGTIPTGLTCHWRLIYDDTAEAVSHRRQSDVCCLELGSSMGIPDPSLLVELARIGGLAPWMGGGERFSTAIDADSSSEAQTIETRPPSVQEGSKDEDSYQIGPFPGSKPPRPRINQGRKTEGIRLSSSREDSSRRRLSLFAMTGALVFVGILGVVLMVIRSHSRDPRAPDIAIKSGGEIPSNDVTYTEQAPDIKDPGDDEPAIAGSDFSVDDATDPRASHSTNDAAVRFSSPTLENSNPNADPNLKLPTKRHPFDDIRDQQCRLKIPLITASSISGSLSNKQLARLAIEDPQQLKLVLLGGPAWFTDKSLELEDVQGEHRWVVKKKSKSSLKPDEIGEFTLTTESDSYQLGFLPAPNKPTDELQFCWLGLKYGDEKILVALRDYERTNHYFEWSTLQNKMSAEQPQKIPLPKLAEKQARERLRVQLFLESPYQLVQAPAMLIHDGSTSFAIDVEGTRVPFQVKLTVNPKEAKLTWQRGIRLREVRTPETFTDQNTDDISELKVVPKDLADGFTNTQSVEEKIESCKKHISILEKKRQEQQKSNVDKKIIDSTIGKITQWKRSLAAFEDNKKDVEAMISAYSKLSSSTPDVPSRIGVRLLWDTGDELKGWPDPPSSTLPLNVLSSPGGN